MGVSFVEAGTSSDCVNPSCYGNRDANQVLNMLARAAHARTVVGVHYTSLLLGSAAAYLRGDAYAFVLVTDDGVERDKVLEAGVMAVSVFVDLETDSGNGFELDVDEALIWDAAVAFARGDLSEVDAALAVLRAAKNSVPAVVRLLARHIEDAADRMAVPPNALAERLCLNASEIIARNHVQQGDRRNG